MQTSCAKVALHNQISSNDSQIEKLLHRIVVSNGSAVVTACGTRIETVKR